MQRLVERSARKSCNIQLVLLCTLSGSIVHSVHSYLYLLMIHNQAGLFLPQSEYLLVNYYLRRRRLCFHFGLFVCLFVCPSNTWKSCERILTKFLGGVGHGPGTNEFSFCDDPDHRPDPGVRSPKSGFTGFEKVPTDFDEILRRAGVYVAYRDQLIITFPFWWRSALLSGSGKNCHILLCWRSAEVCALWVLLVLISYVICNTGIKNPKK